MQFDSNNHVNKLCAKGMELEGEGSFEEAGTVFLNAWNIAENDIEKFIAAHYVARHQKNIEDKLQWDETALKFALKMTDDTTKGVYPSLYLNVAKCHEDLNDFDNARKNYQLALSFNTFLSDDGYGKMIKGGIMNGLERVK